MAPTAHLALGHDFPKTPILPGIEQELIIQPQARSIVYQQVEAIQTRIKGQRAGPAGRKIIRWQTRGGSAAAPVEVNSRIIADNRRTG
jgi:hypothetical protein